MKKRVLYSAFLFFGLFCISKTGVSQQATNAATVAPATTNIPPAAANIPPGAADQTISQSSVSCPIPMSSGDYQNALNAISNADGENRKLCLARDIMSSNCLLAEQVKGFMELFQQEISKLEFAKLAYEYTYDKGNYSTVNAAFQDASSAGKLSGYLSGSSH